MTLLSEVHGLTEEIKAEICSLTGPCPGFGIDSDGLLYVYEMDLRGMHYQRLAEGWY